MAPLDQARADRIIAAGSGLASPDAVVDFGANLLPNFTPVTTEFPPLTLSHASYFTTGVSNNLVGGFLTNDFSGTPNTLRIQFAEPVSDVSFVYHQISTTGPSTFRALLGGVVVDSFQNLSNQTQPNNYFGFTNLVFDTVELDFVADFNVDTVAYNLAGSGEPGSVYCTGDGSGSVCPCAAFGGTGEGCLTTSGSGASLTGTGSATIGADTMVLSVSGGPANKPGIFFQGNNQLAGNPAGDGLLCTAGSTVRYEVNPLDASGATSQGGFGDNASAGATRNYQYWFRDTGNTCGGGFNFTNGYSVTWN